MYCFESFTLINDGDINPNENDSKETNKEKLITTNSTWH